MVNCQITNSFLAFPCVFTLYTKFEFSKWIFDHDRFVSSGSYMTGKRFNWPIVMMSRLQMVEMSSLGTGSGTNYC